MWTEEEQRIMDNCAHNIQMNNIWTREMAPAWAVPRYSSQSYNFQKYQPKEPMKPVSWTTRTTPPRFTLKEMYNDIPGFWDYAETLSIELFKVCKEYYIYNKALIKRLHNPLQHIKDLVKTGKIRDELTKLKEQIFVLKEF